MQMYTESKIPVFVFPHSISFILEDKTTHKQVLTLYNPYEFSIKFKVLGTCPGKYIVVNPIGTIPPNYRIDVVIRHNAVIPSNCDIIDKFRIQIYDKNTKQVIGKQDVHAVLKSTSTSKNSPDSDHFEIIEQQTQHIRLPITPINGAQTPTAAASYYVVLTIAIVCIGGLCLPTGKDDESSSSFHVNIGIKLIFSYVLGLVTMVILKP